PSFAGTLYFWTHRTGISASNPGPDANNFVTADYAMYNYSGGVATSTSSGTGSPAPTGYIASGQGFLIDAQSATSIVFNNSMRSKLYNNSNFYRSSSLIAVEEQHDRIWLNLQNEQGLFSQQLVGYFPSATIGFDHGYDGVVNPSPNSISFYSLMNGANYRIQGRPAFTEDDVVPIGFSSSIEGAYNISIDHAEGQLNSAATNVYLEDLDLGIVHDLKQSPYTFSTGIGTYDSRFQLRYIYPQLSVVGNSAIDNDVLAYASGGNIIIKSENEKLINVTIHDLLGKILFTDNNVEKSELIVSQLRLSQQVLIISIISESGNISTKKIIF
ncbi:MAG TPA: T9SS sorting signal type C domain-containing protein, partial [Flavobacterium sp.]